MILLQNLASIGATLLVWRPMCPLWILPSVHQRGSLLPSFWSKYHCPVSIGDILKLNTTFRMFYFGKISRLMIWSTCTKMRGQSTRRFLSIWKREFATGRSPSLWISSTSVLNSQRGKKDLLPLGLLPPASIGEGGAGAGMPGEPLRRRVRPQHLLAEHQRLLPPAPLCYLQPLRLLPLPQRCQPAGVWRRVRPQRSWQLCWKVAQIIQNLIMWNQCDLSNWSLNWNQISKSITTFMFQFKMQGTPSLERWPRKVYRQVLIFFVKF